MRKILFITVAEGQPWGANEYLWGQTAEILARRGHDVRVSVKKWSSPVPEVERLRAAGCRVSYRTPRSLFARLIRRVNPRFADERSHIQAVGGDLDLVVISQGANMDGLAWMEAALRIGLRYAPISHGVIIYWWPEDPFAKRLAAVYEGAAAAYFVSQANVDLSRLQFGSPLVKAQIVRNPFNVRYDACPAWPGDNSGPLALACVGRLDVVSKGQDILLQALALPRWRRRDIRVSLIGSGPHEHVLRGIASRLGLSNVDFRGHLGDIEGVWSAHHALILSSRYEGLPITVVEAMLCGRPCIVTDVGGNRELVRDGINGFIAKAPTVELLDEAMDRAWEQRGRLRKVGEQAAIDVRKWVSANPAEEFADRLLKLVESAN